MEKKAGALKGEGGRQVWVATRTSDDVPESYPSFPRFPPDQRYHLRYPSAVGWPETNASLV